MTETSKRFVDPLVSHRMNKMKLVANLGIYFGPTENYLSPRTFYSSTHAQT